MNDAMKLILLVEDNPDDVSLVMHAFKRLGIMNPVAVVRDGVEALDFLFARNAYHARKKASSPLVILDLQLPKLDGLGVLKAIRENAQTSQLPVFILTSSKEDEDLISGYSLGIAGHIRKSVDFVEFSEAIKAFGSYWLVTAGANNA